MYTSVYKQPFIHQLWFADWKGVRRWAGWEGGSAGSDVGVKKFRTGEESDQRGREAPSSRAWILFSVAAAAMSGFCSSRPGFKVQKKQTLRESWQKMIQSQFKAGRVNYSLFKHFRGHIFKCFSESNVTFCNNYPWGLVRRKSVKSGLSLSFFPSAMCFWPAVLSVWDYFPITRRWLCERFMLLALETGNVSRTPTLAVKHTPLLLMFTQTKVWISDDLCCLVSPFLITAVPDREIGDFQSLFPD